MAKANRESITIEYCDIIGEFFKHQITEHEAESMFFALQEVLDIEWGAGPDCPGCGVREGDQHKSNCPTYIVENYDNAVTKSEWVELVDALKSIANSSCCDDCQEAKRIAEVALYKVGLVDDIPVRGTAARDWELYYSNLYMAVAQQFQGSYGLKMSAADWDSLRRNFPRPTKV